LSTFLTRVLVLSACRAGQAQASQGRGWSSSIERLRFVGVPGAAGRRVPPAKPDRPGCGVDEFCGPPAVLGEGDLGDLVKAIGNRLEVLIASLMARRLPRPSAAPPSSPTDLQRQFNSAMPSWVPRIGAKAVGVPPRWAWPRIVTLNAGSTSGEPGRTWLGRSSSRGRASGSRRTARRQRSNARFRPEAAILCR
jgi:hypothetical protein